MYFKSSNFAFNQVYDHQNYPWLWQFYDYSSGIVHFRMHFVIADQKRSAGGTLGNTALDEPANQYYTWST